MDAPVMGLRRVRDEAVLPRYATTGAAAMDLCVAAFLDPLDLGQPILHSKLTLMPGEVAWCGTGWQVAVPRGYVLDITPRSGKGAKHGLILANGTGVIDSDYRGEVMVVVWNRGKHYPTIHVGDAIAQARLMPCPQAELMVAGALGETARGTCGFGSTDGSAAQESASHDD